MPNRALPDPNATRQATTCLPHLIGIAQPSTARPEQVLPSTPAFPCATLPDPEQPQPFAPFHNQPATPNPSESRPTDQTKTDPTCRPRPTPPRRDSSILVTPHLPFRPKTAPNSPMLRAPQSSSTYACHT